MRPYTRHIPHVADMKLAIHADTVEGVFIEAARAVARWGRGRRGERGEERGERTDVGLVAGDVETLLADWINELLGRSEIDCAAYECIEATVAGSSLTAQLRGVRVHEWRCPVKAATYHDLRFERIRGRWRAQVLCDT